MNHEKPLGKTIKTAPQAYDTGAAQQLIDDLGSRFAGLTGPEQGLIQGVAGCSPYLRRLMLRAPDQLFEILNKAPSASLGDACERAAKTISLATETEQLKALRQAKDKAALAIALADIAGVWGVMQSAHAVSTFCGCGG